MHTKKYTERNKRDETFGKEQDGNRYTEKRKKKKKKKKKKTLKNFKKGKKKEPRHATFSLRTVAFPDG